MKRILSVFLLTVLLLSVFETAASASNEPPSGASYSSVQNSVTPAVNVAADEDYGVTTRSAGDHVRGILLSAVVIVGVVGVVLNVIICVRNEMKRNDDIPSEHRYRK